MEEMAAVSTRNADSTWSIPEAALIGIVGLSIVMTLLFCSTLEIERYRLYLKFNAYQLSTGSTLISLIGAGFILGPIVLLIVRKRQLRDGWWESIEWNRSVHVFWSILLGALLAILLSLFLTDVDRTAGYLREPPLAVSVSLYILTAVLAEPVMEEMYFRGILFIALAKRLGEMNSIVVVTFVFAFIHPGHRLNVLPVAVLLGIVRLKAKSVASCFALHASYNLFLALCQLLITR